MDFYLLSCCTPLLAPELDRVRKKTLQARNLEAASCTGLKGALVRALRSRERSL